MDFKKYLVEDNLPKVIFFISLFVILYNIVSCWFNSYLRYDEIFTLTLIQDNIFNIVHLTALDVHPPLYYLIVKVFILLFGWTGLSPMFLGEICSSIPFLLLSLFGFLALSKHIGRLAGSLFSFCVVLMPQMYYYMSDIRMYGFCMLFVTLVYFVAYKLTIKFDVKNALLFILFSALALYTQYYCGVAIVGILILLLAYFSLHKKSSEFKKTICMGVISLATFIPWVPTLIDQLNFVSNGYWIGSFNEQTLLNTFFYFVSPSKVGDTTHTLIYSQIDYTTVFLIPLLVLVGYCVVKYLINIPRSDIVDRIAGLNFLTFGALVVAFEVLLGVFAGLVLGKTIIHVRYLVIGMALAYLSVSIIISKIHLNNKKLGVVLLLLLLIGGVSSVYSAEKSFVNESAWFNLMKEDFKLIQPDDLVIDASLSDTGFRESLSNFHSNNTMILQLDTYWEPPYLRVYESLNNKFDFGNISNSRVQDTLVAGHSVFFNGMDMFYNVAKANDFFKGHKVVKHPWLVEIQP